MPTARPRWNTDRRSMLKARCTAVSSIISNAVRGSRFIAGRSEGRTRASAARFSARYRLAPPPRRPIPTARNGVENRSAGGRPSAAAVALARRAAAFPLWSRTTGRVPPAAAVPRHVSSMVGMSSLQGPPPAPARCLSSPPPRRPQAWRRGSAFEAQPVLPAEQGAQAAGRHEAGARRRDRTIRRARRRRRRPLPWRPRP